jgi:nitrite reductase (NADH) small subunit
VRCPWHGWEYDLETGVCPDDDAMRVAVYPVRIEAGRVLVEA